MCVNCSIVLLLHVGNILRSHTCIRDSIAFPTCIGVNVFHCPFTVIYLHYMGSVVKRYSGSFNLLHACCHYKVASEF